MGLGTHLRCRRCPTPGLCRSLLTNEPESADPLLLASEGLQVRTTPQDVPAWSSSPSTPGLLAELLPGLPPLRWQRHPRTLASVEPCRNTDTAKVPLL